MKKVSKYAALIMVVVMACSMLASCAGGSTYAETAGDSGIITVKDKDPVVIVEWEGEPKYHDIETSDKSLVENQGGSSDDEDDKTSGGNKDESDKDDTSGSGNTSGDENTSGGDDENSGDEPLNNEDTMTPITKETSGTVIKLLSQNVKHGGTTLHGDKGDGTGTNIYNRLRRFKSLVLDEDPDIIFNQEARRSAINFFTADDTYMASTYTTIYRYRAWSDSEPFTEKLGGDQSEPVLFKTAKYKELDSGSFWISDNLTRSGNSFCNSMPDVSSWAKLQDKESGEIFWIICYHPAPEQNKIGIPGMALIHDWMEDHVGKKEYCFVGGDYNLQYRNQAVYDAAMDYEKLFDLRDMAVAMWADGLCELGLMASGHNLYMEGDNKKPEPQITYNNPTVTNPQIDYVMAKPMPNMAIDYYGFNYKVYDYPDEGISRGHISDHFGVVCHVRIGTKEDYSRYQDRYEYGANPMYFDPATVDWK